MELGVSGDMYNDNPITLITAIVVSLLSLNGACFMILCYFEAGNRKKIMTKLIFILAVGDALWAAVNVVTSTIIMLNASLVEENYAFCVSMRVSLQIFAMCTVVVTGCIATQVLWTVLHPVEPASTCLSNTYVFLSIFLPLLQNGLLLAFYESDEPFKRDDNGWCMPTRLYHLIGWITPIAAISVYILITLVASIIIYGKSHSTMSKPMMLRLTGFVVVYSIVWIYDIVMVIYRFVSGATVKNPLMIGIFFTVNASGFGNWIVYGIFNKQIREMYTFSIIYLFWIAPYKLVYVLIRKSIEGIITLVRPKELTPVLLPESWDSDRWSSKLIETTTATNYPATTSSDNHD